MRSLLFIGLIALFFSCQNIQTDSLQEESGTTAQAGTVTGASFVKLSGENVNIEGLKGKVVLMNFWATWCPPCIREMPSLQSFYDKYQGHPGVEFMVIEVDNKPDLAKKFIEENRYTFPIYSPVNNIPTEYLGQAIPTTVILNKNGEVAFRHEGMSNFMSDKFIETFEGILGN